MRHEADLDLCVLNRYIGQRLFRMLTVKQLLECIWPGDLMTSIDLTDVYCHVPILMEVSVLCGRWMDL